MRDHTESRPVAWAALGILALASTGCAGGLMPSFLCFGGACAPSAQVTDVAGAKKLEPGQAANGKHAGDGVVPASFETPSQALSAFSQKLAAAEDDRKVLTIQVQQLQGMLEAKDQALAASVREVEATRADVAATRAEMERWKERMTTLQARLRTIEKEDMGTLESLIKILEQALEEGKEPPAPGKPSAGRPEPKPPEPREGK
jgi:hypothetical protein